MLKTEDDWCIYKESGGRGRGGGISEKCVNLGTQEIGFIGLIWHIWSEIMSCTIKLALCIVTYHCMSDEARIEI